MLTVTEIFKSIQGESTHAGRICSFVRLTGCNLRCAYCDTEYAWSGGRSMTVEQVVAEVNRQECGLVEVTGGEPLGQEETPELCRRFMQQGKTVLVETNGSLDIGRLPQGVIRIMDVKCPASGMSEHMHLPNIEALDTSDEVKFVISDHHDYNWAAEFVARHRLLQRCTVIFSPNTRVLAPRDLAAWIIEGELPVRLGLQLHKVIWGDEARGV